MLVAADAETRMTTSLSISGQEGEGAFAVPAKILLDSLKEVSDQPLVFEIDDVTLEIAVYFFNGKYNFLGISADGYPEAKSLSSEAMTFNIASELFLKGLTQSFFATADDELRPVMNGIYLDLTQSSITFVASDGHKLSRFTSSGSGVDSERAGLIMPKKPSLILRNLLSKDSDMVTVSFDSSNAYIVFAHFTMVCRLIEGRYPNYNAVIPQQHPFEAVINRIDLLSAVRRVAVFSKNASNPLRFQIKSEHIRISTQDVDYSTAAEEIIECQYNGDPVLIGFKGTFLIDILSNLSCEEVLLQFADMSRAALLLPTEQEEQEDLLILLMPVAVAD